MDFYEWPEYETFFLQLEFRWWTCKNSIDWHVSDNNMTQTMTSYLIVRKSHSRCFNDILNAWNVFAIDFIDEQPGTIIRIHIPSKFCCVGLRTLKFYHPMRQTWVKTSQYPCVISPNRVVHSEKVMKHSKFALSSICELPYRLYWYLRNIQVTGPVGNSSYQAKKPVTLSVRGIVQLENEIWFLIITHVNKWC